MTYPLILNLNKKTGVFSSIICAYIFTGDSIVFAHIDKTLQKEILTNKKAQMKSENKGFIKQSIGMMKALDEYVAQYHNKSIEEILTENTLNFVLKNEDIKKISFRPIQSFTDPEMVNSQSEGKLLIKTNDTTIKATHRYHDNGRKIKTFLKSIYGKKAR